MKHKKNEYKNVLVCAGLQRLKKEIVESLIVKKCKKKIASTTNPQGGAGGGGVPKPKWLD